MKINKLPLQKITIGLLILWSAILITDKGKSKEQHTHFKIQLTESTQIYKNLRTPLPKTLQHSNAKIQFPVAPQSLPVKSSTVIVPDSGEIVECLNEGFEGDFPGDTWTFIGTPGPNGQFYQWGVSADAAYSGSYSAWCCVDTSGIDTSETYPDNCVTWLITKIPAAGINWAVVNFKALIDLNAGDYFYYMASVDTSAENKKFYGHGITGSSSDTWQALSLNLKRVPDFGDMTGYDTIWIAFVFTSDFIPPPGPTAKGVSLDDITIHIGNLDTLAYANNQPPIAIPQGRAAGLAFDGGSFWYSDWQHNQLVKLNSLWGVSEVINLDYGGTNGLVFVGDTLWNVDWATDSLYRIMAGIPEAYHKTTGKNPNGLTWDGDFLWYSDFIRSSLTRFSPNSMQEREFPIETDFPTRLGGMAHWHNVFFLSDWHNDLLYLLDSNQNIKQIYLAPDKFPDGLESVADTIWCVANNSIYKLLPQIPSRLNVSIHRIQKRKFPSIGATVTVTDEYHEPVLNLKPDDFSIEEDHRPEYDINVAPTGVGKNTNVAFVMDNSRSLTYHYGAIETEASSFIDLMQPGDSAAVFKFTGIVTKFQSLTSDKIALKQAIAGTIHKKGGNELYGALDLAITELETASSPKAIILMTDGRDPNTANTSLSDVIERANRFKTPIYPIGYGDIFRELLDEQIAQTTGGIYYEQAGENISDSIYAKVSQKEGTENKYYVSYKTDNNLPDGTEREVVIRVNVDHLTGYDTMKYWAPGPRPVTLWIADTLVGTPGCKIEIPIHISNVLGAEIYGIKFTISYDHNVLNALTATTEGTIAPDWYLKFNSEPPGVAKISMAGSSHLTGASVLVKIIFSVKGEARATTKIHFEKALFNEGVPRSITHDGFFTVGDSLQLSGKIHYYSDDTVPVDSVQLVLENSRSDIVFSDANGFYKFVNLPLDNFKICPSRTGTLNDAITPLDASLILKYITGIDTLSPLQKLAADVSGDDKVLEYDAELILQFCTGKIKKFDVGAEWTFVPHYFPIDSTNWFSAPRCRSYDRVTENLVDQDFDAIVYGDVTGNWRPDLKYLAKKGGRDSLLYHLSLPEFLSATDESINLMIDLKNMGEVYSFGVTINYDPAMLKVLAVKPTDFTQDFSLTHYVKGDRIRIAAAGAKAIHGSGSIINLQFEVANESAQKIPDPLVISKFSLNEMQSTNLNMMIHFRQSIGLPTQYGLSQNYPNPFNMQTIVKYQLPEKTHVKIEVINLLGQRVCSLVDEEKEAGYHQITWSGKDGSQQMVSSGVYLCRFQAAQFMKVRKIALLR